MKNFKISNYVTYLFIILFLGSCTKENTESKKQISDSEELLQQGMRLANPETFERNGILYPSRIPLNVSCGDNQCTTSTDNCAVAWDLKNNTAECSCAGCKMTLSSREYHGEFDYETIINTEIEFDLAKSYAKENYKDLTEGFNSVELHFSEKFTTAIYKFELADGQIESFVIQSKYDKYGKKIETIVVDCTGACDGQVTEGCTEVYDIGNGTVTCSCTGCKMKVDKS